MDMPQTVNYDELATSYTQNLNTMLRGFHSGQEFLDLWVHDDDDTISIANMIESAGAFKIPGFVIRISESRLNAIDASRLTELVKGIANLKIQNSQQSPRIEVSFR